MTVSQLNVVLAGYYPPPLGGESVHVQELAARLRAAGILKRVVNLRRGAPPSSDYVHGAGVVRLLSVLIRELSGGSILHLHTNGHSWKSWGVVLCAALVLRIRGKRGVLTLHSGMGPDFVSKVESIGTGVFRFGLASFAHVVCVNEEIYRTMCRLGAPKDRVSVIPAFLGATPVTLQEEDERMLAQFYPLLSVVAGTGPEYGLAVLIDAVRYLKNRYAQIGCLIIGTDGAGGPVDMVRALELSHHIHFLGPLPHERCLAFVARSDIFVRPSLYDGDAISVREALSLGIPIVASNTASRPQGVTLFKRGDSGDLADKIIATVNTSRQVGSTVRVDDFSEAILSVYWKVVGQSGRRWEHAC